MLSFLNPWLLWALPAALLPIVIHLLFLRKARRVPFSDLTLLRSAYRTSLPAARLRQWLLLAVRCLLLAGLIGAFARPVLHSGVSSGGGEEIGLDVVLLLDVSYSMDYRVAGRPRLEAARRAGQALARSLRAQDRAAVASFSDRVEGTGAAGAMEWSRDAAAAGAALGRLKPSWRTTDYLPALRAAYELLHKSSRASRRGVIVLLSDGAAHGWRTLEAPRLAASLSGYDPEAILLGLAWADRAENGAIEEVRLAPGGRGPPALAFRTRLSGPARPAWDADLWSGAMRAGRRSLDIPPGPGPVMEWALPAQGPPARSGRLSLRTDSLPADDEHHYSFWVEARSRVLMIHGGPRSFQTGRGAYFLKKLLGEGTAAPAYELEIADALRWRSLDLSGYRAVVLADFRSVPDDLGQALLRYVRSGGGLWVLPAAEGPESLRALAPLLPARMVATREYGGRALGIRVDEAALREAVSGRPFSWEDFDLQNVSLRRAFELEPAAEARVWLRDVGGRPLLVSRAVGEGRVLLWAGPLDVQWGNIALKPVFVAMAESGLGYLARRSGAVKWRTGPVGSPVVRTWGADEPAPATARVRGPDGRAVTLQVVGRRLEFIPDAPGLWRLEGASRAEPEEVYAAHLDRSTGESDLALMDNPPWRPLRVERLQEDFQRVIHGREARTPVLAAVLALLALETILANPRKKAG